jgi:2-dehydropantoate 2-reductase
MIKTSSTRNRKEQKAGTMQIKNIVMIGRGAIGVIFGSFLQKGLGSDHFAFVCDEERKKRYSKEGVVFNGEPYDFRYITKEEGKQKADLIILCTKYTAIKEAIEEMKPFVKEDTIILSTMNGLKSEDDLRAIFGESAVIRCIAQKMSSVYKGNEVIASPLGELVIGSESAADQKNVALLQECFDKIHLPYHIAQDIKKEAMSKLMLNCGINQTCAAYHLRYQDVQKPGKMRDAMIATMHEVQAVALKMGIVLTDDDFAFWMKAVDALDPQGMPSMAQDVLAHRPTEIELFAGYIVPLAHQYGISVPYNEKYLSIFTQK